MPADVFGCRMVNSASVGRCTEVGVNGVFVLGAYDSPKQIDQAMGSSPGLRIIRAIQYKDATHLPYTPALL